MSCEWCSVSPLWVFTALSPVNRGCYGPRYACAAHLEKTRRLTRIDGVECKVTAIAPLPDDGSECPTCGSECHCGEDDPQANECPGCGGPCQTACR